jgi:hypothetical protein
MSQNNKEKSTNTYISNKPYICMLLKKKRKRKRNIKLFLKAERKKFIKKILTNPNSKSRRVLKKRNIINVS